MAGPINPYDAPPPQPQGMTGTTKVLLGLGIGCAVLLVLCCGILGVSGVWLANYAQESLSEDSAKVVSSTKDIVDIDIPAPLEPKAVFDVRVPFTGQPLMLWVSYEDTAKDNRLVLGQFGPAFQEIDNFETQLQDSMNKSGQERHEELDVEETDIYEARINDEDAKFTIVKGKGRKSDKEFWETTGSFRGHGGQAMLILRLDATEFTKEQFLDIIKSMEK